MQPDLKKTSHVLRLVLASKALVGGLVRYTPCPSASFTHFSPSLWHPVYSHMVCPFHFSYIFEAENVCVCGETGPVEELLYTSKVQSRPFDTKQLAFVQPVPCSCRTLKEATTGRCGVILSKFEVALLSFAVQQSDN